MILFEVLYYSLMALVAVWLGGMTYHTVQMIRFARAKSRSSSIPKYRGRRYHD